VDQQLKDLREARDKTVSYSDTSLYGLLVLAAAVDRASQSIDRIVQSINELKKGL